MDERKTRESERERESMCVSEREKDKEGKGMKNWSMKFLSIKRISLINVFVIAFYYNDNIISHHSPSCKHGSCIFLYGSCDICSSECFNETKGLICYLFILDINEP